MQKLQLEFPTVTDLVDYLERSQYETLIRPTVDSDTPIMTRHDLRTKCEPFINETQMVSRTSGSTGIPLVVPKNNLSVMWHSATNVRELKWRKWRLDLRMVAILARIKEDKLVGKVWLKKLDTMQNLQKFLEGVQPHYLYTYPSIIAMLDLSKLTELIDIRSVGEIGATSYTSEETGTIALQCPDNPAVYHIMENIIVEVDVTHGILITDLTNPLICRYAIGDHVELGTEACVCARTLQTITKIKGRVRNMLVLPNGDRIWPTIGEPKFLFVTNKIRRHQAVQKTLTDIELRLQVRECLTATEESDLLTLVRESIGYEHLIIRIVYVDDFPAGKFEAFKCEVSLSIVRDSLFF